MGAHEKNPTRDLLELIKKSNGFCVARIFQSETYEFVIRFVFSLIYN